MIHFWPYKPDETIILKKIHAPLCSLFTVAQDMETAEMSTTDE